MKTPTRTTVDFSPVLLAGGNSSFKQSVADFFLCSLSNRHTQVAYANDISMLARFLASSFDVSLEDASPVHLGAFRKQLEDSEYSVSGIRRKVAAVRAFYSHLAGSGIITHSPAANLKSPKLHREQGATPIFNSKREIRTFINSYDESGVLGLRNRALFSVLFFSMARVSAVCGLNVGDIKQLPTHVVLVFREKRGKIREVPLNSFAADILLRYVRRAQIHSGAIFRAGTIKGSDILSRRRITRNTVHYLMKSRLKKLGLNLKLSSHSWRGTGATMYLSAEGSRLEHAQKILGHGSSNTTRLYDRRKNSIPLLEVERLSL